MVSKYLYIFVFFLAIFKAEEDIDLSNLDTEDSNLKSR